MSEAQDKIMAYKLQVLQELYDQLTKPQKDLFDRIFKSVQEVNSRNFDTAIRLCEATIVKNKAKIENANQDN